MKRFITAAIAVMMLISAAGCGSHRETAEEHAEKLARGEVESKAKIAEDAAAPKDEAATAKNDEAAKDDKAKPEIPTADPALNIKAEVKDDGTAEFSINTNKTSEYIDKAENDYKSFSLLPVQSADFFKNKKLKLVAVIENHKMSFIEGLDMTLEVTDQTIKVTAPDGNGGAKDTVNRTYMLSDPITTPGGAQYVVLAFGDHELSKDNSDYNVDCFALIDKPQDTVAPEDPSKVIPAGQYVLLIETVFPERYELFKVE